jgi:hypothetical protein
MSQKSTLLGALPVETTSPSKMFDSSLSLGAPRTLHAAADSFLLAFHDPDSALGFAVELQVARCRSMLYHRSAIPLPSIRDVALPPTCTSAGSAPYVRSWSAFPSSSEPRLPIAVVPILASLSPLPDDPSPIPGLSATLWSCPGQPSCCSCQVRSPCGSAAPPPAARPTARPPGRPPPP